MLHMPKTEDKPGISTVKVSSQGQITLSKEARDRLSISAGETLIEIAWPGCRVLLPQSEVMTDLMFRAQKGLSRLGLSADQLKDKAVKRRKKSIQSKYPGMLNG
jgi:AbrB family looped-hinge helix DNA binding protein